MTPMPTSQHLVIVRVTPEVATSTVEGVKNLFAMVEKYTDGQLAVVESKEGDANVYGIALPPQSPFQPAVAQLGEVFVFCTSKDLLEKSLKMMAGGEGTSKFDDPRLRGRSEATAGGGRQSGLLRRKDPVRHLRGLGPFIQTVSGGDPNVERVVKILDKVWDDVAIIDYEVTVRVHRREPEPIGQLRQAVAGHRVTRRCARCCPAASRSRSGVAGSPPAHCPTRWVRASICTRSTNGS